MSPQEAQILQDFLNQLTQVKGTAKDPQADTLIANAVGQQPDAAYLLVQRALLMDQALNAAKMQITSLQNQLQALQPPSRGFLDPNAWGNSAVAAARPAASPQMASLPVNPPASSIQAPAAVPTAASGFLGGGLGSVLGTVAATAAGVAGGAFLFQGIEHLMGHNSGAGLGANFLGQQSGASSLASPVENTTINNYFGDDATSGNEAADGGSSFFDSIASDDRTDDDAII